MSPAFYFNGAMRKFKITYLTHKFIVLCCSRLRHYQWIQILHILNFKILISDHCVLSFRIVSFLHHSSSSSTAPASPEPITDQPHYLFTVAQLLTFLFSYFSFNHIDLFKVCRSQGKRKKKTKMNLAKVDF